MLVEVLVPPPGMTVLVIVDIDGSRIGKMEAVVSLSSATAVTGILEASATAITEAVAYGLGMLLIVAVTVVRIEVS